MKMIYVLASLLSVPFFLQAAPYQKVKTLNLQEAIDQKMILLTKVKRVKDQGLQLHLKNIHKRKDFKIRIETGLQFASRDTSEQDQIILQ